jgi:hypothetical protein
MVAQPDLIVHELQRAQAGEWLPQELQARRRTISEAIARLERQKDRLLDAYLAEIISREEFERKSKELKKLEEDSINNSNSLIIRPRNTWKPPSWPRPSRIFVGELSRLCINSTSLREDNS